MVWQRITQFTRSRYRTHCWYKRSTGNAYSSSTLPVNRECVLLLITSGQQGMRTPPQHFRSTGNAYSSSALPVNRECVLLLGTSDQQGMRTLPRHLIPTTGVCPVCHICRSPQFVFLMRFSCPQAIGSRYLLLLIKGDKWDGFWDATARPRYLVKAGVGRWRSLSAQRPY
jgi:hypothetical protein